MNRNDEFALRWQRLAARWEADASIPPGLRALVADIVALEAEPALPPPDLTFLPPVSFATYVRQIGERLSTLYFPERSQGVQAAFERFFRALNPQQPRLVMESPPVYGPQTPNPLTLLTTTYIATVRLLDLDDPALPHDPSRFALTAYDVAVAEAQRQGLSAEDADQFAAAFVEEVRSTIGLFERLEAPHP